MGDENKVEPKTRQLQKRSKIIIRKCKKTSVPVISKSVDDSKKVNGELSTVNKSETSDVTVNTEDSQQNDSNLKPTTTSRKRKLSAPDVDDIIALEDNHATTNLEKKDDGSDEKEESSSIEFKGFKKRILAQTEKLKDVSTDNTEQGKSDTVIDLTNEGDKKKLRPRILKIKKAKKKAASNGKKGSEGDSDENQSESQTEYAQYLGLQPTMQFKCYRCGEKGFPSMLALNMHQRNCGLAQKANFIANLQQDTIIPPSDPNMLTNFRITRKVYLCSACGTYYENWNLFLHMRDVHKKHICLFCLTMFGMADKLADHLKTTHSVQESTFNSSEEFQNSYKGSCYLICCTCENMFNEREDYIHHQCVKRDPAVKCNLCGVKCGHYYTCPNSNTPRTIQTNLNISHQMPVTKSQSATLTKYTVAVPSKKITDEIWMGKKVPGLPSSDNDDDYDISHAASFCHVDIGDESGERDKSGTEDNPVDISDDSDTSKPNKGSSEKLIHTKLIEHTLQESIITKDDNVNIIENQSKRSEKSVEKESISSTESYEETCGENKNKEEVAGKDLCKNGDEANVANPEEESIDNQYEKINSNKDDDSNENQINENTDNICEKADNQGNIITTNKDSENPDHQDKTINETKDDEEGTDLKDNENIVMQGNESSNVNDLDENSVLCTANKENIDGSANKENNSFNNDMSKELQNTLGHSEDTLSQGVDSVNDIMEADDASNANTSKPQISSQEKGDDSTSSESDEEPVTHMSVSQDDSESSSDESSDEEKRKADSKQSVESNKDDSACESDDSSKSGLVVDEKPKNLKNDISENIIDKSDENTSEEPDIVLGTKSTESDEESTTFHLDNVSSTDRQMEDENKSPSADVLPEESQEKSTPEDINDGIPLASDDVPAMALTLEDKLEDASSQSVVKECVRTSCLNCVYCSHAIKIAVNGKQLALHLLAEHRYKPVKNNETSQDVVKKLKSSLPDLESIFFNTDSYDSSDKSLNSSYDYTYECFQCRFVTKIHKELYVHKRKMHQKTVLLCVMCKANFYSYSELLCHMCPGIYVSEDINFRCCFCNLDMIPSAFRLMVHLRKSHHTCDICLEVAGDQQKLSTHMWKHKLNHLCYRCGIAYRNKPDITKHLFWKHGTESVLCKKCLQKKWPHVYHFCIPPTVFICEECNTSFTKAVALKVHKRFHGGELPYGCSKCDQKFVSKKLLGKHEDSHNQPLPTEKSSLSKNEFDNKHESTDEHINVESIDEPIAANITKDSSSKDVTKEIEKKLEVLSESKSKKKKKRDRDRKEKPVLDVYDFPPLNLSSESDSSDEEVKNSPIENADEKQIPTESKVSDIQSESNTEQMEASASENVDIPEENSTPVPIVDGVWDNFHSYKAELEKRESKDLSLPNILPSTSSSEHNILPETQPEEEPNWALMDHSYCLIPGKPKVTEKEEEQPTVSEPASIETPSMDVSEDIPAPRGHSSSIDHAYATLNSTSEEGATAAPTEEPTQEAPPTTPPPVLPLAESHSSSKKRQKTPKKKKRNTNSSSSSDSSSDSDTSCSCGPNCSCSSSSSNSSSSSSSDSDSSTSEGRRRAAARRQKKKERLKHKHHKEPTPVPVEPLPPPPEEESAMDSPVEPVELPIRESDLDTDESSTDEDFYDKYPQSHAKQQMEKRNKLMLLASVAPVNNGTVSPPPAPPVEQTPPLPAVKRKIKTKRRRKSQSSKKSPNKSISFHLQTQPSTSMSLPTATSTPSHVSTNHHNIISKVASPLRIPVTSFHSDATAGSGSENESARSSKRKRVRNKFYGYSSEEEELEKPSLKWRKVESAPLPQPPTPGLSFQSSLSTHKPQAAPQVNRPKESESSESEEEAPPVKKEESSNSSSSSSSESENEVDSKDNVQKEQTEKSDNLYCYCQCPYDEVSEMIACDGQDCTIEWFHFECVGIMVPPKGKWYCPDCRKRRDLM